ncbi:MAG: FeoB-associated Cys-rich membrane protein [Spirochaetales bacterium]|jgi:hypothetical protein|nr:FeoB-associated Cys-rich membrane protein [Spirochaetales bacterium]MBQ2125523.1 FeoB-associated Cys-rich membrane protein [Spirochaetales bacterium]
MGTVIVLSVLALTVVGIIYKIIHDRKSGKGCGCNCGECGGKCSGSK